MISILGADPQTGSKLRERTGGFVGTIETYEMQKEKLGVEVPRLAPPSAQTGSKFHEVTYG